MRHGIRPPTKARPVPAAIAPDPWPAWPVAPGWLTPHGAAAVGALAATDRTWLSARGVWPRAGCPAPGAVRIIADSDQRTIATAEAWAASAAPNCGVAIAHRPQGEDDADFGPIGNGTTLDAAAADSAVAAATGPGGLAALDAAEAPLVARLDAIVCGTPRAGCGIGATPTAISAARPDARPKLSGGLDLASSLAQSLLLAYADGKPLSEVGWGRASAADITALSAFHALEFRLVTRPKPVASAILARLGPVIAAALGDGPAAKVTLISGHDSQVAALAGLLDAHWQVPGFAPDDPVPGGAIVLERRHGMIRASYRAQPLEALRAARGEVVRVALPLPCARAVCTPAEFARLLTGG